MLAANVFLIFAVTLHLVYGFATITPTTSIGSSQSCGACPPRCQAGPCSFCPYRQYCEKPCEMQTCNCPMNYIYIYEFRPQENGMIGPCGFGQPRTPKVEMSLVTRVCENMDVPYCQKSYQPVCPFAPCCRKTCAPMQSFCSCLMPPVKTCNQYPVAGIPCVMPCCMMNYPRMAQSYRSFCTTPCVRNYQPYYAALPNYYSYCPYSFGMPYYQWPYSTLTAYGGQGQQQMYSLCSMPCMKSFYTAAPCLPTAYPYSCGCFPRCVGNPQTCFMGSTPCMKTYEPYPTPETSEMSPCPCARKPQYLLRGCMGPDGGSESNSYKPSRGKPCIKDEKLWSGENGANHYY
ncbi:unnamed protein product [Calicophoron daubneyi]|uniref:Uncharacterized protein n=1 Tax=Calicophoron daubneyi TaxID=300641 RepID=A0AAV2T7X4_CALDB